jgi:tetrahydromethanopterin S-methyltransferase subunit C
LPCREKKNLDDSSRLDVVEIAHVPDMLPSLFIYVGMEVKTPFNLNLYSSRTSEVNLTFAVKEVPVPAG